MQTAGVWPRLLDAASWAPSPHNTQPWLVHPRSDTVAELYVPAGRTLPYTDASGAFATNALGIFVEALDVAAAAEGLTVEVRRTRLRTGWLANRRWWKKKKRPRSGPGNPSDTGEKPSPVRRASACDVRIHRPISARVRSWSRS
jgi:hypothetical protein